MPDTLGNITVPEIAVSGTFPIVADYPFGRSSHPDVAIHQFGSGNAKIEQRFLLGAGAKRFTVRRAFLRDADRRALRDFWESKYGPYGAFTYNAPNDDGNGTTAYTCRFANEPLSWEMLADHACSLGVTLRLPPAASWITATLSVGLQMKYSGTFAGKNIDVAVAVGLAPKAMWQSVVDTTRTTVPPIAALCTEEPT